MIALKERIDFRQFGAAMAALANSRWRRKAALGVSLVPTVMQMRCIVWEPSDWFRWGTMVRKSEVIGNGRKSSEKFGSRSRRSIKEGHLSCYYTLVKRELIYGYEGWGWHMWERKGPPAQGAGANQNACAVPKIEKGCKKRENRTYNLGKLEKREARTNVNSMC